MSEYKVPDEIKNLITLEFLEITLNALAIRPFNEKDEKTIALLQDAKLLKEEFEKSGVTSMAFECDVDEAFEWNVDEITQIGGTGLWFNAIKTACETTDSAPVLDYYKTLTWIEGDKFDDMLCDLMVEHKLISF